MALKAVALNGTLKASKGEASSTDRMLKLIADGMEGCGVKTKLYRLADHNILPGVTSDEGEGDAWPAIRSTLR